MAVPANVSTVPSPHETFNEAIVPSGSVAVIVKVIEVPVATFVADSVNVTVGARSAIVLVATADFVTDPLLSVALTYTWKVAVVLAPVLLYAWLSLVAVPAKVSTVPSPHETLRLLTVPSGSDAVIVRMIVVPVVALVADSVKLTVGARSVTVFVATALLVVEPLLSVAFT